MLLALVVLSLASVALIIAFSTSISASAEHRRLVTADLVVGGVSQDAIASIDAQLNLFACEQSGSSPTPTTTTTFQSLVSDADLVPSTYSSQFTASITGVQWWNGAGFSSTCTAGAPEEVTVTVENSSTGASYTNTFVVTFPLTTTNAVSGSAPATSLAFSTEPSDTIDTDGVITDGEAGAALETQPVVEVLNSAGDPVATDYSPVILSIASGPSGASLSDCLGDEQQGGVVTFTGCIVSLPGTYTLLATDGSLTATSSSFTIGDEGDYLVFTHQPAGGLSGGQLSTEPEVTVDNAEGGRDTAWSGTITLTSSGGVLSPACTGTITAGGTASWTAPAACTFEGAFYYNSGNGNTSAAPYIMTASGSSTNSPAIPVVPATSIPFYVTGPGTPSQLVFTTQPTGATGITASTTFAGFSVTMEDAFGNVAYTSGANVSLSISSGNLTGCSSGATSHGVATFTGCYGSKTGNGLTLTATAPGLTPATSQTFNITSAAYELVFTRQPVANVSGATFVSEPEVTVEDDNGNVVTASTAAIALTASGGDLSLCTSLNAVEGVVDVTSCTFAGLVGTSYTMTATSPGLLSATSDSFTPSGPGVATQIVFTTEPVAGAAGSPFTTAPAVSIEDSGGNIVTTAFSTATFAVSGGTLSCPDLTVQVVDGLGDLDGCTFGGVVLTPYQLTVSSPNLTSPTSDPGTATSANFTPSGPGPAAQVAISASSTPTPPPASASANVTLTLQLEDAWGNDTTSTSATQFSMTSSSSRGFFAGVLVGAGTLGASGSATIPANTGSTTVFYGDENAGQPLLGAENVAAAAQWGEEQLDIVPAAPSQVALTTTCPSTLASGSTCTITAAVEDLYGNTETAGGSGVVFAEGAGDAGSVTLSGQSSSGGTSTITVTGEREGAVTLNTTTPFVAASPVSFTVGVGPASKIAISGGASQTATVGTSFTSPLSALVTDTYGNPVAGAVVTFAAPASGASGTFLAATNGGTCLASGGTAVASCTAVTNASGVASSLTFTATDTAGAYNVAATSPGTSPNPLDFAEANTPAAPTKVLFTTEPPTTAKAGTALTTFKVSIEDQYGNTVTTGTGSTDDIALSIATGPSGGVFNSAPATYTNVAAVGGVATFSGVYFETLGSYTLTATDSTRALTTATSTPATTVSPGAPSKVLFTTEPPTTTKAGATLASFAVSVEDAYGNVETTGNTGSNDTIALTSSCTLGGTDSVAAVNGAATFSAVTITKGTSCTLTATDSTTLATATSTPATTVSPAGASKVIFTIEPPTTATAGTALTTFAVSVVDTYGNVETTGNTGSNDTIALTSSCTLGGTD
ncbi:MAG: beta strand repeat-containing protein, partial [Acidimicrobiales bacterium]